MFCCMRPRSPALASVVETVCSGALLAALVLLCIPCNVESVAWVTERKNVLSGVFYFSSILVYLMFLER